MWFSNIFQEKNSMSIKYSNDNSTVILNRKWKCFGCCHVHTAALFVGFWHLIIHVMGLLLFISAYYLVPNYYCDLSLFYIPKEKTDEIIDERIETEMKILNTASDINVWALVTVLSFSATVLFICATVKKMSVLILPFLMLQIFDIFFDLSVIIIYLVLSSNVADFTSHIYNPSFQRFLVHFGSCQKTVFAILYIIVAFAIKMYLSYVVYLYYCFLSKFDQSEESLKECNHIIKEYEIKHKKHHISL